MIESTEYLLRYIIISILLLGFSFNLHAQDLVYASDLEKKYSKKYKEAIQLQRSGQNVKALKLFDEILKDNPGCIDIYLNKSGIFYGKKEFSEAKAALSKAVSLDPEYNIEMYFSLALINERLDDHKAAISEIDEYLSRINSDHKKYERANELRSKYTFIADAKDHPVPFDPEPLPDMINTSSSEYAPGFSADGSQFYFVRRISGQEDILVAENSGAGFSSPELVEEILSMDNEGVFALSADGLTLIFTGCNRRDGFGSCDLYYTKKNKNGKWSYPSNMGPTINTPAWDAQPSLNADGSILYFSSRRNGSVGKSDIWKSRWTREDGWSEPENLGGIINTLGSDETPFIHPDGKTLYFRSDGREGMGGFDLYVTRYDDELNSWDVPMNLGYPINTKDNEGGLTISLDGMKGYFSSDKGKDNVDIYQFELYEEARPDPTSFIKVMVKDSLTGKPLEVSLNIDNHTKGSSTETTTNLQGESLFTIVTGNNYGLSIEKEGYLFHSELFRFENIHLAINPSIVEVSLIPIQERKMVVEKPTILKNIFFESGSAVLREISLPEIKRLVGLLQKNPQFDIIIIGHTDSVGTEEDNLNLSTSRAKAVYDQLIKSGISVNRVTYVGKGENEPIDTNETEEGRQKNRRTEFLLSIKE